MLQYKIHSHLAILGACLLLVTSCSGGSSAGPTGGDIIDRSGRNIGTIKGFSSVIVNEVTYDISGAVITVDDQNAQEDNLAVGQVVVVEGLVNADGLTGSAERITTDPGLRGPIVSLDPGNASFVALGTTVLVDAATVFDGSIQPGELTSLVTDDVVEVYGFTGASGQLRATLITRSNDPQLELRGQVTNLNSNAGTFNINTLIVDYSNATLEDFVDLIADGDLVEVEGTILLANTLQADKVELESASAFDGEDEGAEVEIEGLVTRFASSADFDISGVTVSTTAATEYESGTAQDIALNVRVEVEGRIDADGVLVADEIEFEQDANLELLATVEAVDAAASSVTLLGITFTADASTALIDESDAELQFFSLSDVALGDYVKAKARSSDTATRISLFKRINSEDKLKLEGPVTSSADPSVFVGTAQIDTDAATEFYIDDTNVSATEFFADLLPGDEVSAEGQSPTAGVLLAESIEKD